MNILPEIATGTGAAAVVAAAWRYLRSSAGKEMVARVRNGIVAETRSLREAVENLAQVVAAQGESIEWLRSELDRTRVELSDARTALTDKEGRLERDNEKLRKRVAELEAQVKALEAALASKTRRPRTTTTKAEK
jgi:predicted RNase H-like nuclease (RuvC/YqgF family)